MAPLLLDSAYVFAQANKDFLIKGCFCICLLFLACFLLFWWKQIPRGTFLHQVYDFRKWTGISAIFFAGILLMQVATGIPRYRRIKSNYAETCGATAGWTKRGKSTSLQRFSYRVNGRVYHAHNLIAGDDATNVRDIPEYNGQFTVVYNKQEPQECFMDVSRPCDD